MPAARVCVETLAAAQVSSISARAGSSSARRETRGQTARMSIACLSPALEAHTTRIQMLPLQGAVDKQAFDKQAFERIKRSLADSPTPAIVQSTTQRTAPKSVPIFWRLRRRQSHICTPSSRVKMLARPPTCID